MNDTLSQHASVFRTLNIALFAHEDVIRSHKRTNNKFNTQRSWLSMWLCYLWCWGGNRTSYHVSLLLANMIRYNKGMFSAWIAYLFIL